MIDKGTIDRILDTANIVDVVSEFVTLKRRGVNYVGLCPFHDDRTPSFYVSPAKNICKCFACGEGGTSVHFVMKHEQLSYPDALRFLAKKYHIELNERELTEEELQVQNDRESMLIVNNWAQKHFETLLHQHDEGRSIGLRYFKERGFREDVIKKFGLGYSLDQWDELYQSATKSGYKQEYLEKTGLIIVHESGKISDRFRGRVLFPVHSLSGKVVAFGGRILKKNDRAAKYVNSPESEIYHKSNELYGIYFARQQISKQSKCFLVEGYTDVLSMHQAGLENVVASSGTALTSGQIRLIRRFTENITVIYDGDSAGINAALRGIDLLLEEGMNVKVVLLPDGEDPDSFAKSHSSSEFLSFVSENEVDFINFKVDLLLKEAGEDPIKRAGIVSDVARTIAIIPNNIVRSFYVKLCAPLLKVQEQLLVVEVRKLLRKKEEERQVKDKRGATASSLNANQTTPDSVQDQSALGSMAVEALKRQSSPFYSYEEVLMRYVVRYGERIIYRVEDEKQETTYTYNVAEFVQNELTRDDLHFFTPLYKQMLEEVVSQSRKEGFSASRYLLAHTDSEISRCAANLLSEKYQLSKLHSRYKEIETEEQNLNSLLIHGLYTFKDAYIMYKINEVQEKIKKAQSENNIDEVVELMTQVSTLNEIKSVLNKQLGERIILKM